MATAVIGVVIFAITQLLISARRLSLLGMDRPAAALLGAVACVAAGVLAPRPAVEAIDGGTLVLLFGVMGMGAFLSVDGCFDQLEARMVRASGSPQRLLGLTVWGSGVLSAFVTNDAVCLLATPMMVRLIQRHRLPPLPFLLAVATAANTGSVATLVGNPQNMLCGQLGELSYAQHLLWLGPVAVMGLGLCHGWLALVFRHPLAAARLEPVEAAAPMPWKVWATLGVIAGTAVAYSAGLDLPWTAAGGFVVLMLLHRQDTTALWPRIDWALLVFFASLFVVVGGFVATGAPAWLFEQLPLTGAGGWWRMAAVFLVGSNVVSNVPFILVVQGQLAAVSNPALAWELLAMASTFAGNLTLIGSVANLIVAEAGRPMGGIGFWDYLKVGAPLAVATSALGTAWLMCVVG